MRLFLFIPLLFAFNIKQTAQHSVKSAKIGFQIKNAGLTVNGTFGTFTGSVNFNPQKPAAAKVSGSVKVKSIDTHINARNNHLMQAEYFDEAKYPEITMVSKFFVDAGKKDHFRGYFYLTIKGVTKEVMVPVTYTETGNEAVMEGEFKLNRLDFGVGKKSLILSDEVIVHINLNLNK